MDNAAAGLVNNPDPAPIITPPAKVAFRISYMLNFPLNIAVIIQVDKQLPVNDIIVFAIIVVFSYPV
jgi:hypothetical protein